MIIRPATDQDIPSIVELLKLSLGDSLMPKSEALWRWKHIDNPFGKSPVLLAFENDALVGVRAFMRWEWKYNNQIIKAARAVDTATHPNYQGKGIFKKLTLRLVEMCEGEDIHFIFNTPNEKSMPGYLKMGWIKVGRLPVRLRPVISWRLSSFEPVPFKCETASFPFQKRAADRMVTHYPEAFFQWRYAANPNFHYFQVSDEGGMIIYRLKKNVWGTEFRVVDSLGSCSSGLILEAARLSGARAITLPADVKSLISSIELPVGPMVTTRVLNFESKVSFHNWSPTLGDMEVF